MLSSRAKNSPACSPDGKWVVFEFDAAGKSTMWRVPIEGGKPQPLSDKLSRLPVISPDGTQVAMYLLERARRYATADYNDAVRVDCLGARWDSLPLLRHTVHTGI
jgi:Tol biopolymer transport system component